MVEDHGERLATYKGSSKLCHPQTLPPPGLSEHAKQWSRNCPDSKYCWEAKPVIDTAEAMEDLVGGDWNDDYWGESGGFIYG